MFRKISNILTSAEKKWTAKIENGLACYIKPFGRLTGTESDLIDILAYGSCQVLGITLGPTRARESPFVTPWSAVTPVQIREIYPSVLESLAALHNIRSNRHEEVLTSAFASVGFAQTPIFDASKNDPSFSAVEISRMLFVRMQTSLREDRRRNVRFDAIGSISIQFILNAVDEGIVNQDTRNI